MHGLNSNLLLSSDGQIRFASSKLNSSDNLFIWYFDKLISQGGQKNISLSGQSFIEIRFKGDKKISVYRGYLFIEASAYRSSTVISQKTMYV
ncbi:CLUMA_CG009174, isoform A [Clunio marinus]|uniref:CLUMA_CG009174, isoform A n=1 Tax=Clunio marinus TaxID=568069 RepID=A0A1J1I5Z5_9DIPT|nr:CLUMA_CG009174, isoform A [Clunio marinus]